MAAGAQAKVLRVLQSGELMHVGGHESIKVDVRVLASTHRKLPEQLVRAGRMVPACEDLYFRLIVVTLHVPPLRERRSDIPMLVSHFVATTCRENGLRNKRIDDQALAVLQAHEWPGNVRELRNIIERMVILSGGRFGGGRRAARAARRSRRCP